MSTALIPGMQYAALIFFQSVIFLKLLDCNILYITTYFYDAKFQFSTIFEDRMLSFTYSESSVVERWPWGMDLQTFFTGDGKQIVEDVVEDIVEVISVNNCYIITCHSLKRIVANFCQIFVKPTQIGVLGKSGCSSIRVM